jgi:hypothetical protein
MVRLTEIAIMSLQHLEFEALKILTALEDMNSARTATAINAVRALADALADTAEACDSAAKIDAQSPTPCATIASRPAPGFFMI